MRFAFYSGLALAAFVANEVRAIELQTVQDVETELEVPVLAV